jgi:hypothetical protein
MRRQMASYFRRNYFFLFAFGTVVQAYTVFETTCKTPITNVNFVSSPDSRGTLDILWSSLFTIFACTWTIQHLNVPEQREGRDRGWKGDLKWMLKGVYTSVKWMLLTMVAPEFVIGRACVDRVQAKRYLQELLKFAKDDHVPWTLAHTYYANMGGFVVRSRVGENILLGPHVGDATRNGDHTDITASAEYRPCAPDAIDIAKLDHSDPGSFPAKETPGYNDILDQDSLFYLDAQILYELRREKIIPKLPSITKEELEDKSKSDPFVKAIAIVQISWATLQIIVRAARKLPISQLELAVLAFAACAVVIYGLYWAKPKGIQCTTTILQYQHQIPPETLPKIKRTVYNSLVRRFFTGRSLVKGRGPIRNDSADWDSVASTWWFVATALGAVLFCGIHVAAWNFTFPTRTEAILWRCASIYATAFMPIVAVLAIIVDLIEAISSSLGFLEDLRARAVIPLLSILYLVARLFLLVEVFRTLCFLPHRAYLSTWATNIPHVS